MSAVAAAQRPFTKCRGHISPLLIGYHKLSLVVCSLFNVSCQLSLAFARQTMCPVTSAPDPTGGAYRAYDAPPHPLVGWRGG